MINKNKFQRKFFDILITSKGFFVEEIGNENNSLWLAMKTLEDGSMHYIILSNKNDKDKNNDRAYNYLIKKGGDFSLSNIVIFNKKIQEKSINSKKNNEILVDLHNKKIYGNNEEKDKLFYEIINTIFEKGSIEKKKYYSNIGINEFTKYVILILISLLVIAALVTMFAERNSFINFFYEQPIGEKENLTKKLILFICSGRFYHILKDTFLHDGIINLIINLYILYILVGIIDLFKNRKKFIIIYIISAVIAGIFNFLFVPYISITISITGAILGILGLTLIFSIKERNTLGNWVLINILIIIFLDFALGGPSSFTYYISHTIDILIGALIGIVLYKNSYLKKSFYTK